MVTLETKKQVLDEIKKRDGIIIPQAVVDEARQETSPIHDCFEWDDTSAGEKYRLWQARQLITSVEVEWKGRVTQAYHNVEMEVQSVPQRGYQYVEEVLSAEELKKQVLKEAVSEIRYWQKKYNSLKELVDVVNEKKLEDVEKQLG